MLTESLKTAADFEAERHSEENRQVAKAIGGRLLAFIATWRDYWHEEPRGSSNGTQRAMKKAHWLLDAIGGEMLYIPQANNDGTKGEQKARFMLILSNGMNWQNLRLESSQEAVFATFEGMLEIILQLASGNEEPDLDHGFTIYGKEGEWFREQANGLLTHALQVRVALETRETQGPRVPIAISHLAAKSIAAVGSARTRQEWADADKPDNFWWAGYQEYTDGRPIVEALAKLEEIYGANSTKVLNAVLDWNISVQIAGQCFVDIRRRDYHVNATISTWFSSELTERANYLSGKVRLKNPQLPEAIKAKNLSGAMDEVIDHWLTRGLGFTITESHFEQGLINKNDLVLDIEEAPGPILLMPWLPDDDRFGPKVSSLRNPLSLRKR